MGKGWGGGRGREETPGRCPGWDAIPGDPISSAPHPPTMSISLVRELTRSETEERGSVLRSDSSCGGCPGTGAVFTALLPAGNLGKERQRLREEGPRAEGETARGSPGPPLLVDAAPGPCQPSMEAASWDAGRAGLQGRPGLCHRRLRATRCSPPSLPAQRGPGRCGRLVLPVLPPGRAGCQLVPRDLQHVAREHGSRSCAAHVPPAMSHPRRLQSPR